MRKISLPLKKLLLYVYHRLYHVRFWIKTALYRWTPGGYGYYRHLRRCQDSDYVHERDKHPVRYKHYGTEGWGQDHGQFTYRQYTDYDEYLVHQKQKFSEMLKIEGGFTNQMIALFRIKFFHRFRHLHRFIRKSALIVCAGARQGTEVEVLHDLGFKNSYGIDLNPGSDNSFVRLGDFMMMDNPDNSIDLIYTNCIDHAYNLERFFAEHRRVIKPDGFVLYDLHMQSKTGAGVFEAVEWKKEDDLIHLMLRYFGSIVHLETDRSWKWILLRGKNID